MASARTINAPGIELREIDRSKYGTQDNSLPNAPAVLVTGVASKGENYSPQWINNKTTFIERYGAPSTTEEKYFYNACVEVLNRGGICIASKIPYDNVESQDGGRYTYCDYHVDNQINKILDSDILSSLNLLDENLTSYIQIYSDDYTKKGTIDIEDLDYLKTGKKYNLLNKIRIVDISRTRYEKADFPCVTSIIDLSAENTDDILGIFPVIVSPTNAIYFQKIFDQLDYIKYNDSLNVYIKNFNPVSTLETVEPSQSGINIDLSQLSSNLYMQLADDESIDEETVSKIATQQFPLIGFKNYDNFDTTYLRQIGVVVFKAYRDQSQSNKVNFQILESFVGSLDKNAKSDITNSSIFIDDLINNNSQYINFFSNVDRQLINQSSIIHIQNQCSKMLGFYEKDCQKNIKNNNLNNTILDGISRILERCKDPNQIQLDLVVDAGVSNIAQYYWSLQKWIDDGNNKDDFIWEISNDSSSYETQTSKWRQIIKKFDDFCHYTRKDCMFIADGLRPFCLIGDQKKVRPTKIDSSVEKDIIPYIRNISGINSSYSAGYCNWFYSIDDYSGDYFWCPPSIKASSIYIYCDTYFHSWDAPAGLTRGMIPNTIDTAFNPNKDEAGKIYLQSWNYAINYPMEGCIMEGQKTFQTTKTALDRVNVRRLLIKLEKQVTNVAKYFLYEGNTAYLRQRFVDSIRPYFDDAVNGNGISEYIIKCDDEINTIETIDNNELHCKIAIKPIKTIEFIVLSFICTSQAAVISEEVMK